MSIIREDEEIYLIQDDTAGPLSDEINFTEEDKKRIEDIKKRYGIKSDVKFCEMNI